MKVDAIVATDLADAAAAAARAEAAGCDGIMVPEVAHDPFPALALAAAGTTKVRLATGIAVAFARNPMSTAVTASDLHRFSGGRLVLGLGSQIKPHITRRFSMPWSDPTRRMREYLEAVRAIWSAWETQTPLAFRGEFYEHTLMTPMFDHGPSPCGWPPIHLAAVGPAMTAVAGAVADGLICHGFTTADYLRDVTIPNLERGLAGAGRTRADVEVTLPVMCAVVEDDLGATLDLARATIAFYGSTPAYRAVLEHHGWGELGDELHARSRKGEWATMATLVDDDVVDTFCAIGDTDEVAAKVNERFGGVVDRLQLGPQGSDEAFAELVSALRAPA